MTAADDDNIVEGFSPAATFTVDGFANGENASVDAADAADIVDAEFSDSSSKPHRERKKKNPSNRRVDELLYQRGNLEQQNTYLAQLAMEKDAYIAEQQRQLQALQQIAQQTEQQKNQFLSQNWENQEESINQGIKRAKEDGDIDAEIRLINELADIKAKKNTHTLDQHHRQQAARQQIANEDYVPIETHLQNPYAAAPHAPPVDEAFVEWVEENPWYANNPRLRQEADELANRLADNLTFNGHGDVIGTPQFRDTVTKSMRNKYGWQDDDAADDDNSTPAYSQPAATHGYAVAPVTRTPTSIGGNMANQYVQNNPKTPMRPLTKEEFAIARHLPQKMRGESEADLVRRYAQSKNYPKSPLEGGTPNRLTIL